MLAGVNGAGKSSIGGAAIRAAGADYFNPDEVARAVRAADPSLDQASANSLAWQQGKRMLEKAIREHLDFAIETTLGGSTMARLIAEAASQGIEVRVFYVGLASADAHIERVRQRVRGGGHDIPDADIRRRYRHSRLNLVHLLPALTELRVYDNSAQADPAAGQAPQPQLVLHVNRGRIIGPDDLSSTPDWAKPIVAAALELEPPPDA
ncbi:ZTL protein [Mycobacterium kyorinense]|uniref:ZTL protein n=1 Tax=Mycobacterium kyorinense TaxID=487514 RepID=A0A1A2Z6W2_9MYCO|nr:ZTL protein [Mycobacterium kyorinense]